MVRKLVPSEFWTVCKTQSVQCGIDVGERVCERDRAEVCDPTVIVPDETLM